MGVRIEFLSGMAVSRIAASCTFTISSRIDSINENDECFVYSTSVAAQAIATLSRNDKRCDNNLFLNIIFDCKEGI